MEIDKYIYTQKGSMLKETTNFNMAFSFMPCEEQTLPAERNRVQWEQLRLQDMELRESTI